MEEALNCDAVEDRRLVERYLAGTLSEQETEAFESHYLTCLRCQNELRLGAGIRKVLPEVRRADEGIDGKAPEVRTRHWFHRPARVGAVAAALAAVFIGLLLVQPSRRGPLSHREGALEGEGLPNAVAPVGEVPAVEEFRWARVDGADLYRLTLFDADGQLLWEIETPEVLLRVPETLSLEPRELYLWQVDARVGWDRWISSEMVGFRLSGSSSGR